MIEIMLKEISTCNEFQKESVRKIRNNLAIRTAMYSDHIITPSEHINWLNKNLSDLSNRYYVVLFSDHTVTGVVSYNSIDAKHKKSDWAFYLSPSSPRGLGSALEFFVLNHAFNGMALEKLNCEVLETNFAVVKMHQKFGFSKEGFRRSNIIKDKKRIGVHLLGITKSEWIVKREEISSKYEKIFENFYISI